MENNKIKFVGPEDLEEVTTAIYGDMRQLEKMTKKVVNVLPTTGEDNIIYLVPKSLSENENARDEYMWINGVWEKIGDTTIDLSDYIKKTDLHPLTSTEIADMIARAKGEIT